MIYLRIVVFALLALALCPRPGHTQDSLSAFKGKTFDLPTPAGFCTPDSNNNFAKRVTALLKNSGNTIAKIAADCRELQRGTNQYDYIVYYYPTSTETEVLDGDVQAHRKALCDDLRAQTQEALKDVSSVVAKTAKELKQKFGTNNTKYLGVLAEDAHGCYAGLLSNISTGNDSYILNIDMLGTVIHARRFYVALYSEYKSPAQSEQMLAREQALAAELDSKNPD